MSDSKKSYFVHDDMKLYRLVDVQWCGFCFFEPMKFERFLVCATFDPFPNLFDFRCHFSEGCCPFEKRTKELQQDRRIKCAFSENTGLCLDSSLES